MIVFSPSALYFCLINERVDNTSCGKFNGNCFQNNYLEELFQLLLQKIDKKFSKVT